MRKVALITGGSSGIGLAVASELASQYSLILVARKSDGLAIAKQDLEKLGTRVETIAYDVTIDPKNLETLIEKASVSLGGNGKVQVLVHSAGVTIEENANADEERSCFNTNVVGTENTLNACANVIEPKGFVLVLSSLAAFVDLPGISKVYGSSKRETWKTADSWRKVYGWFGSSISIAFPPVVDTPMVRRLVCSAPIYRAFPWLTASEVAKTSLRGMFSRK